MIRCGGRASFRGCGSPEWQTVTPTTLMISGIHVDHGIRRYKVSREGGRSHCAEGNTAFLTLCEERDISTRCSASRVHAHHARFYLSVARVVVEIVQGGGECVSRASTYVLHVQLRHSNGRRARVAPLITAPACLPSSDSNHKPLWLRFEHKCHVVVYPAAEAPYSRHAQSTHPLQSNSILILITC